MSAGSFPLPADLISTHGGLIYGLAKWAYIVTDGLFWAVILIGFCVVLFMGTVRFGNVRAFSFASVAGLLASIMLATLQLLDWWFATIFILVGLVGFAGIILSER